MHLAIALLTLFVVSEGSLYHNIVVGTQLYTTLLSFTFSFRQQKKKREKKSYTKSHREMIQPLKT